MSSSGLDAVELPETFTRAILRGDDGEGRRWLEALPRLVADVLREWGLARDGGLRHGHCGIVLPVRRGGEPLALKLTRVDAWNAHEAVALRMWAGDGVVQLVDARPEEGVLLLERLDPDRDLRTAPIGEALIVAGDLLRRLYVAKPGELDLPGFTVELKDTIDELEGSLREGTEDRRTLAWARSMLGTRFEGVANTDLHYENVLAGSREPWLVVDPKVAVAPIGFGIAPLLWNRTEEIASELGLQAAFDLLVERTGADRELALECTRLRCLAYAGWTRRKGFTRLPENARRISDALR